MFECLVEGCGERFARRQNRRHHLSQYHKFPSSYRYDEPRSLRKKRVCLSGEARCTASSTATRSEGEMDDKSYHKKSVPDGFSSADASSQRNVEMDLDDDNSPRNPNIPSEEEGISEGISISQDELNYSNVHGDTGRGVSRLRRGMRISRRVPAIFSFGAAEHGQEGGWGT
mmetsp:Transcript_4436/g.5896  ORF Transcript_4436/g.5896 Transcript_4436/m.5896 type:complete len:171 (-) Transcript_4436:130-642(-)